MTRSTSFGVALGGVLNIILDPVFIFGFHLEITGAAVATMLSNLIATLYFIALILSKHGNIGQQFLKALPVGVRPGVSVI